MYTKNSKKFIYFSFQVCGKSESWADLVAGEVSQELLVLFHHLFLIHAILLGSISLLFLPLLLLLLLSCCCWCLSLCDIQRKRGTYWSHTHDACIILSLELGVFVSYPGLLLHTE